eukprot:55077-Prymnesium_polylepis.1
MNTPPTSSGRASRLSVAILEQRRRIWVLRGGVGVARVAGKILRLEQLQLPAARARKGGGVTTWRGHTCRRRCIASCRYG